ncbi:MAG TPA: malto-oligosyltrehalose synthase [Candidatus Sulfotelmatobacter sp.]|nr:malto-oligosyltrehalose synthase [Candidatus Sulfotelmatobacter sp.]
MQNPRLPSSTYRIQLNQNFRFADTLKILDYLHELGVSDVYLSPILASRKGSTHGYDLIDPSRINPDLGTEEEFTTLQTELQNRGMGLLLDIVPNHMAANAENPWWMDVLENGAESAFAAFFDIEWHPHARSLEGRILLPVLGRPFGEALDSGEIKLLYNDGRFFIQYFESLFPVAPRAYHSILNLHAGRLKNFLDEESAPYHEYSGILSSARDLSRADRRIAIAAPEQRLRFESTRDRLRALTNSSPEIARLVGENVAEINGTEGDPASFGLLQRLLAEQNYKLAFWQNLNESINYRRFFTIADLVGVRVEDPLVFEASHGYILRLVSRNPGAGLRVDHIDGLRDPVAYLNRLQERLASDDSRSGKQSYVLVEKILARGEELRADWPVSGTTGYDYLNEANGIFVDPEGARCVEEIYSEFIGRKQDFSDILYQKKKLVMNKLLGVEMRTLGRQLAELAAQDRYARELNRGQLIDALIEVTACMPIYRTYIRNMEIPPEATRYIEEAVVAARKRAAHLNPAGFDFIREVLLLENPPHVLADQRETRLVFVMRWQQFTGPIVAKGFEDTALYVFHPLLSLNEVGGNPRPSEAESLDGFYHFLERRQQSWPGTLDATSTHDTKRSEDVRARINVLSEIPEEWKEHLDLWVKLNGRFKQQIEGQLAPDRNEEYFLYQTLIGVWPLDQENCKNLLERVQAHLVKATREAMVHTRWTRPNQAHEEALQNFAARILSPENGEFLHDFLEFEKKIAYYGMINGLSQVLLKIAAPGVADFYQGSELWDLRLVDPDNRGVVDFEKRIASLSEISKLSASDPAKLGELVKNWCDGRIKLYLILKALRFRCDHAELFSEGEFVPVRSAGCRGRNVVAFLRRISHASALVVLPRWLAKFPQEPGQAQDWCDTRIVLPSGSSQIWKSIVSRRETKVESREGESTLEMNDLLKDFPVAFLESSSHG